MEISNFEGLSLSKSFEEMSLPNIIDIFNKFKASAMDDDNCEILQSGSFSKLKPFSHTPQQNIPKSKPVDIFLFQRVGLLIWTARTTHFDK